MAHTVNQGLDGVFVANTRLSHIDGERGELLYAGHYLQDLIEKKCSYEDIVFLLLEKRLPTAQESIDFRADLVRRRTLSPALTAMIDAMPRNLDYMDALRTGVSALSCEMDTSYPPTKEQALDCIAKVPLILARYHCLKTNQPILESDSALAHVANYLYLLNGDNPHTSEQQAYAHALEVYFITTIEHGMNASTFGARVSTSTQSDLISSVAAAMSVLKGPLHGGAPFEVLQMLDDIGTKENAEPWIREALKQKKVIYGIGHRKYTWYDPRAEALLNVVKLLPETSQNAHYLELSRHVEEVAIKILKEVKPGRGLYTNVEFGAAVVLRAVGLPAELYPATFALSRCGGWVAHIIEASEKNRLIRPEAEYIGEKPQKMLDREQAEARLEENRLHPQAAPQSEPNTKKIKPTLNSSFLMKMMMHPVTQIASVIIMLASVALFAVLTAGLGLSLAVGYSAAVTGFALGFGLFTGSYMAKHMKNADDSIEHQQAPQASV
jgi:citrate synthase